MKIAELLEQKGTLVGEMNAMLTLAKKEKRDLSDEELEKWDAINKDYDRVNGLVKKNEDEDDQVRDLAESRYVVRTITGKSEDEQLDDHDKWKLAFRDWMINGAEIRDQTRSILEKAQEVYPAQVRQQATTPGSAGGFLTNEVFSGELAVALKQFAPTRQAFRVVSTSNGSTLNWPLLDETGKVGQIVDENTAFNQQDMVFGQKQIGAFKYSSDFVLISFELLQDSLLDVVSIIRDALANRLGRIQNQHYTNGTGIGQPAGVIPAAPTVDAQLAGDLSAADLYALLHSVDPAYRADPSAMFMFNDRIAGFIRQIANGANGLPLWQPSLQAGIPDRLLGFDIVNNPNMDDALEIGDKPILFGAGNRYIIRDVIGIQMMRLNEINALSGQVTFLAWMRSDGQPLIPEETADEWAMKVLEMPA